MAKIDLKKQLKDLYNPSGKSFTLVEVPSMNFLMIDGHGNPNNNPAYQEVVEALYAMAYTLKFAIKKKGIDYSVSPLEGLWWIEDMREFSLEKKDQWDWTMLVMQPEWVTADLVEALRPEMARKKSLPALDRMRFGAFHEGLSVQIMYTGAYADEGPTIARLHAFIQEEGYQVTGKHHEIYLGDPRRTAPEKLKTIIRQPIRRG